ncbi:MAG TPA: hypothetical protein DDW45_08380 [Gammaproteobacteria bacterium]|nr:hypothetical protein [Gammaproteobacteria bacterium]
MLAIATDFDTLQTMLRWKLHFIFILGFSLAFTSGCQSMSERRRDESLTSTLVLYGKVLRWQGPHEQGAMLANPEQTPKNRGITVTSYQVVSAPVKTGENAAHQTAVIEYVYHDSQVIKRVIDQQIWEYDTGEERWLRANQPPVMAR